MERDDTIEIVKFIAHSRRALTIAVSYGWLPGACYTNLRNIRAFDRLGFLDIDWKNYDFKRHLAAAAATKPILTVAHDVLVSTHLAEILDQACELSQHALHIIIVPKDPVLADQLDEWVVSQFAREPLGVVEQEIQTETLPTKSRN